MTVCNMSIEAGARAGMIAPDDTTFERLVLSPDPDEDLSRPYPFYLAYQLALPAIVAELAAGVVAEGPARWTLGPLTEVVAQSHTWVELDPHLPPGPERVFVAHERAIRGRREDRRRGHRRRCGRAPS